MTTAPPPTPRPLTAEDLQEQISASKRRGNACPARKHQAVLHRHLGRTHGYTFPASSLAPVSLSSKSGVTAQAPPCPATGSTNACSRLEEASSDEVSTAPPSQGSARSGESTTDKPAERASERPIERLSEQRCSSPPARHLRTATPLQRVRPLVNCQQQRERAPLQQRGACTQLQQQPSVATVSAPMQPRSAMSPLPARRLSPGPACRAVATPASAPTSADSSFVSELNVSTDSAQTFSSASTRSSFGRYGYQPRQTSPTPGAVRLAGEARSYGRLGACSPPRTVSRAGRDRVAAGVAPAAAQATKAPSMSPARERRVSFQPERLIWQLRRLLTLEGSSGGPALHRDVHSWTALHYGAAEGHVEICSVLLDGRADIDSQLLDRSTPLMLAAEEGHEGVAKLLIERGAKAWLKDEVGFTALDRCASRIQPAFAEYVKELA
eukprot:TRINITY_DN27932_c0_g2_i2.p1 TRINITY_DN27932_c0_g2~~TRINITY_DN27932_c0_g2_i2.p1  ORF type:complete len:439 (-),score=46.07 TRINITY_DN27932_c0_g2_i2:200-1516(-)